MRSRMQRGILYAFPSLIVLAALVWPREDRVQRTDGERGFSPTPAPVAIAGAKAEEEQLRPPALLARVTEGAPPETLSVVKVDVAATIVGFLARTTMTLTFENPHARVLEGELIFPLPEGSAVSGFGLDVGGEIVDGVVVERREARVAFEAEVRRGVDPGLLEWVRGNVFRTRVYPIPASGRRTVKVAYVSDLLTRGEKQALQALYHLPFRYDKPVADFHIRVEVVRGVVSPVIRGESWANLHFERWEDRFVAEASRRDARLDQDLLIAVPDVPRQNVVVERTADGERYFVLDDFPSPPAPRTTALPEPKRVGLVWDASLSRAHGDHDREISLIADWLERLGDVEVELIVLRDVAESPRVFQIRRGDARALCDHLRGLPYDGATRLGALAFSKRCAYHLLVSDGLATLGQGLPAGSAVPVFTLTADTLADHARLRRVAQASGGLHFNLSRVTHEEALAQIGRPDYALLEVETDGKAIVDVLPVGRQTALQRVTLCGRLLADEARITLRYGWSDEGPRETRTYALRREGASETGLVPRFWAQLKVTELAISAEEHHDELLALGRRFGIVTPDASLLVLETLEQHLEHGVEPPPSRAAMREAYLRRVDEKHKRESEGRKEKIERVVAMWAERVSWWERKFEARPPKPVVAGTDERMRVMEQERRSAEAEGVVAAVDLGVEGGVAGGVMADVTAVAVPAESEERLAVSAPVAPPPPHAARMLAPSGPGSPDAAAPARERAKKDDSQATSSATITLKPWDPKTPYLTAMKQAGAGRAYEVYLEQRETYGDSPAFFLDCADFFLASDKRDLARRILSNVVEMRIDDARLARVAAHRYQQIGEHDAASELFAKVLRMRPEEPQSPRDLALALAARADDRRGSRGRITAEVAADYRRAIRLLYDVVLGSWDARFPEVEVVALMDMNNLLALLERDGLEADTLVDPRLVRLLDLDLRVVLTWDTDMTDMDLWVTEPTREKCFYSNRLTSLGGLVSRDFTGGYGPEEYAVRRALDGLYRVQANFYGSRAQQLTGPTTVQATVITDFGRPAEKRRALTVRLTEPREVIDLGDVRVGGAPITE